MVQTSVEVGGWRFGVWSSQVRCLSCVRTQNTWCGMSKSLFLPKKKNFKGSFQVISKSVVVVNITYTMDWDSLLFNTAILIAGVFVLNYGADKFIDHTVHLSNCHCPFDY